MQKENEFYIQFSQEEQALMPGKFQLHAEGVGFGTIEVLKDQPPLPHLIKYRYRKKPNGYPLFQLGDGIFAINQTDIDGYEYDWDVFINDLKIGIELFAKSYPFHITSLPLIDIQLRYRDAILADENESIISFINNKLNIGNIALPQKLINDANIDTTCPSGSFAFKVGCTKPNGQIVCQINQGISDGKKAYIIDFIVISKVNVFNEISTEKIIEWCKDAHNHHRIIFEAVISDSLMRSFKDEINIT